MTVSAQSANSAREVPVATAAFHKRAPSRWTGRFASRATCERARSSASGVTAPPAPLWVFSRHTIDGSIAWIEGARIPAIRSGARNTVPAPRIGRT